MIPYLLIISFSSLLIYLAEKILLKSKVLFWCIVFVELLLLAFFAGVRDLDVGYDVMYYQYGIFETAKFSSSYSVLFCHYPLIEPFFLLINYGASFFSRNIYVALFIISFLTTLFFLLGCYELRDRCPMWLLFTVLLLYFYAVSNNLMRQCLAVSMVFYSFSILLKKGMCTKYFFVSLLSGMSHLSAFFVVGVIFFNNFISKKNAKINVFFLLSLVLLCSIMYIMWGDFLSLISLFTSKDYSVYSSVNAASWSVPNVSVLLVLFCLFCFFIETVFYIKYYKNHHVFYNCAFSIVVCLLCFSLGSYNGSASRLALYFMPIISFYLIDVLCKKYNKCIGISNIFVLVVYVLLFFRTFDKGVNYSSLHLGI